MSSNHQLTPDDLARWLREIHASRKWLAGEMLVSVRTVEKWFAEGRIPLPAQRTIFLLMEQKNTEAIARPKFTPEEFSNILTAMRATGCESVQEFIQRATLRLAEQANEYGKLKKDSPAGENASSGLPNSESA